MRPERLPGSSTFSPCPDGEVGRRHRAAGPCWVLCRRERGFRDERQDAGISRGPSISHDGKLWTPAQTYSLIHSFIQVFTEHLFKFSGPHPDFGLPFPQLIVAVMQFELFITAFPPTPTLTPSRHQWGGLGEEPSSGGLKDLCQQEEGKATWCCSGTVEHPLASASWDL